MSDQEKILEEIRTLSERLKELVWQYLDMTAQSHKGLKQTINEMLDLLDEV